MAGLKHTTPLPDPAALDTQALNSIRAGDQYPSFEQLLGTHDVAVIRTGLTIIVGSYTYQLQDRVLLLTTAYVEAFVDQNNTVQAYTVTARTADMPLGLVLAGATYDLGRMGLNDNQFRRVVGVGATCGAHPERHVVHETIYQAVYRPDLGGLARDLPKKALRTGRQRRKPHRHTNSRRPQPLVDMTMIDARPAEVADRSVPGHWEGDLITGAYNRSAIGTLVERSSRFTILLHLPDGRHTADLVRDALVEAFAQLPVDVRRSLTWDQGNEMPLHAQIAGTLGGSPRQTPGCTAGPADAGSRRS